MRYVAKDGIYNGNKYYKKETEYLASELPPGLSDEELEALFRPIGIPDEDKEYKTSSNITDVGNGGNDDGNKLNPEHTALIEFAFQNNVKARSNWKPETIITKLEEAGITGEDLDYFKKIEWEVVLDGE